MTDIVEHRRRAAQTTGAYCLPGPEMVALCDEIERLRAALTTIRDAYWSDGETADEQRDDLKHIARRALEPKP